jgi:hypothetical protein
MINALANHGYIARSGQDVTSDELLAAVKSVGLSTVLGSAFSRPVYNLYSDPDAAQQNNAGLFERTWTTLMNPWTLLPIGMRRTDRKNGAGKPVLDLDEMAIANVIEHDISLTRRDHAQTEGNCAPQTDLISELLACSKDGKVLTLEDLAAFRKRRIEQQRKDNPSCKYDTFQHQLACGEIALILGVIGDGKSVRLDYAKAFLQEERLPIEEGWKPRGWWGLGFPELQMTIRKVKALVGVQG